MATQLTLLDDHGTEPATCAACGQPEPDEWGMWQRADGAWVCLDCGLGRREEKQSDAKI